MKGYGRLIVVSFLLTSLFGLNSCNKSESNSSATLSATVAGNVVTFSNTNISNSNGITLLQGNSSHYTLTIALKLSTAGIYYLGDQSTGNFVTVTDNLSNISYSSDVANTGQATLTQNGIRYNGTFYCTCNETSPSAGGGNVAVTNGSFTNM